MTNKKQKNIFSREDYSEWNLWENKSKEIFPKDYRPHG